MTSRILLVDDDPRNLLVLEAVLDPLGHTLVRATSGRMALELFDRGGADLVLLDLRMPGLDGLDVLHALRARDGDLHVPVILLTAAVDREDRVQGLRAGADDFIEKPVDADVLLARVRTLLALKTARDALAARGAALEALQRGQRELMELLVHDLKSPIGAVAMNIDFALQGLPDAPDDATEALHDAATGAQRVVAIVEQVLLVARLERADFPLQRERVELGPFLAAVGRAHRREALLKEIAISVDLGADLTVSADPMLLRRVLDNLVGNAVRHTPTAGRVALTARPAGDVEIVVSNTGRPIPPEFRPHLFEKFWRAPEDAATAANAGFGLYFCRRAVEAHGGGIRVVESREWPTSFVVQITAA